MLASFRENTCRSCSVFLRADTLPMSRLFVAGRTLKSTSSPLLFEQTSLAQSPQVLFVLLTVSATEMPSQSLPAGSDTSLWAMAPIPVRFWCLKKSGRSIWSMRTILMSVGHAPLAGFLGAGGGGGVFVPWSGASVKIPPGCYAAYIEMLLKSSPALEPLLTGFSCNLLLRASGTGASPGVFNSACTLVVLLTIFLALRGTERRRRL